MPVWSTAPGRGLCPAACGSTFDFVTDGLSNTLLLVESAGRPQVFRGNKPYGVLPTNRVNGSGRRGRATISGSTARAPTARFFPDTGAINCTNGQDIGSTQYPYPAPYGYGGTGETYSFHPGGANVLLGDGSVRFAGQAVDIRVYGHLVTRDKTDLATPDQLQ